MIELLVVLGIITVLTGIAFPTISMVRASAKNAGCISNLRQLNTPIRTYSQAHGDRIPMANMLPAIGLNGPENGLPQLLKGYVDQASEIWFCPADVDDESLATGTSYMYIPGLLRYTPEVQFQVTKTVFLQKLNERAQAKARTDLEGQLLETFIPAWTSARVELVRARVTIRFLWIQPIDILEHVRRATRSTLMVRFERPLKMRKPAMTPRENHKNEFRYFI